MATSLASCPHIALITNDVIGENMAGPGIRYWEFAQILGQIFSVTLIIPPFIAEKISSPLPECQASIVICPTTSALQEAVQDCQIIITIGVVLLLYPFLEKLDKYLVFQSGFSLP